LDNWHFVAGSDYSLALVGFGKLPFHIIPSPLRGLVDASEVDAFFLLLRLFLLGENQV
jgi:hypothetical protein